MKRTEFKKIDMELVKEIISKKGFYYFSLDRVYERFCGAILHNRYRRSAF